MIRYRTLDENGDYTFGRANTSTGFLTDSPEAVAQAVKTRLLLFTNEWFVDLTDGMPWSPRVLGKYTHGTRDMAIQARVVGTIGVTGVLKYSSVLNLNPRSLIVDMTISTVFGPISFISLLPIPSASIPVAQSNPPLGGTNVLPGSHSDPSPSDTGSSGFGLGGFGGL